MAEWELASIMAGTVNNHGMSAKIISIFQMLQAWVSVTLEQITQVSNMLQDIIKVIMVAQISTMTINKTVTVTKASILEEEVEAVGMVMALVAEDTVMDILSLSHNSLPKDFKMAHLLDQ
jgi:hypothetical protein